MEAADEAGTGQVCQQDEKAATFNSCECPKPARAVPTRSAARVVFTIAAGMNGLYSPWVTSEIPNRSLEPALIAISLTLLCHR
jgi:hypothetical protein